MTLHWLVSRQTTRLEEDEYYSLGDHPDASVSVHKPFHILGAVPVSATDRHPDALAVPDPQELQWAGFNGRCNKVADTCYSWWVGGSLAVSAYQSVFRWVFCQRSASDTGESPSYGLQWKPKISIRKDAAYRWRVWQAARRTARYVLAEKAIALAAHSDNSDLLHSYFGLAALAAMKEPGLLSLDATFCISIRAREHLETLPWWTKSQEASTSSVHIGIHPDEVGFQGKILLEEL